MDKVQCTYVGFSLSYGKYHFTLWGNIGDREEFREFIREYVLFHCGEMIYKKAPKIESGLFLIIRDNTPKGGFVYFLLL